MSHLLAFERKFAEGSEGSHKEAFLLLETVFPFLNYLLFISALLAKDIYSHDLINP